MRKILFSILYIFGLVAIFSCEEEEKNHPNIKTIEAEITSSLSVLFKGEIERVGDYKILDHGFIYSSNGTVTLEYGTKISLDKHLKAGPFEKEAKGVALFDTWGPRNLYYRAYLTNEIGTVYGEEMQLKVSTPGGITGVLPNSGKAGDIVAIRGSSFVKATDFYKVYFNNTLAEITEIHPDKILVKVPSNISFDYHYDGRATITLKMGEYLMNENISFYVIPEISGFSPNTGNFETLITINGNNFYPNNTTVEVQGIIIYPVDIQTNAIYFRMPKSITSEAVTVKVRYDRFVIDVPGEFKINPPVILGISTINVSPGEYVRITGLNFNSENSIIKIGGYQVFPTSYSGEILDIYIPYDMLPGDYNVSVSTGVHTSEAADKITVVIP